MLTVAYREKHHRYKIWPRVKGNDVHMEARDLLQGNSTCLQYAIIHIPIGSVWLQRRITVHQYGQLKATCAASLKGVAD